MIAALPTPVVVALSMIVIGGGFWVLVFAAAAVLERTSRRGARLDEVLADPPRHCTEFPSQGRRLTPAQVWAQMEPTWAGTPERPALPLCAHLDELTPLVDDSGRTVGWARVSLCRGAGCWPVEDVHASVLVDQMAATYGRDIALWDAECRAGGLR